MAKRVKTRYPGVYWTEVSRVGGTGTDRSYIIAYKKGGKLIEERVGRHYKHGMTPAEASRIRLAKIEGKLPTKKEAKKAAEEAKQDSWTLNRVWETYLESTDMRSIEHETQRYRKHLQLRFGEKELSEITPLDVESVRRDMKQAEYAPATIRHVLELLSRLNNFTARKQLCPHFTFKIDYPKVNNEKTVYLTQEQMRRLMEAINKDENKQVGDMLKLALFTGMRRGEILKLEWDHLDFEKRFILLQDPKGRKDKWIPMNQVAEEILRQQRKTDSPYVFPNPRGGRHKAIKASARRIIRAAGLADDIRPFQDLRHSYASLLASSGKIDLYTLKTLMTHANISMTERYAHLHDEALRRAAGVADDIFTEVINGM